MKKLSVFIFMIFLFGIAGKAAAVSPMPFEELKPGQTAIVCAFHITYITDQTRGIPEEQTSTFAFEASNAKKDVLEWVNKYINDKLNERNVSAFKVECKFP
ncbi:MAG: hypothetical protein LUQ20_03275 [Candidatus Methanoperedens sp.]|nr:hypothetical protein [Candidatus Methanoperedens sp.]